VQAVRPAGVDELLARMIESDLGSRDQAEQMAFLRAYAALAGEEAVPRLSKILNGRKWWGGRRSPTLRACAARALGLVGSPAARAALEAAANDRAAAVKSSVRVSLKAIDAEPGERLAMATLSADQANDTVGEPVELRRDTDDEAGRTGEES